MAALLTESEMALWCQTTVEDLAADPYAAEVNEKLGGYIAFLAGQPLWDAATVPVDIKMLAIRAVRRTYVNPDSEVQTGTGPISSRVLDEAALAGALTEAERSLCEGYRDGGGGGGLWTQSIGGADVLLQPTVYLADDQQINLGTELPWMIPFLDVNDVNAQTTSLT